MTPEAPRTQAEHLSCGQQSPVQIHWCSPDCVDPDTWDIACPMNAGIPKPGPTSRQKGSTMSDQPPTPAAPQRRDYGDPYDTYVTPLAGGEVRVDVSAWGYWNVWLDTESYVDWRGNAKAVLQPGEAVSVAWRLVVGAAVCWWKRLPDQLRGRLRSMKKIRRTR